MQLIIILETNPVSRSDYYYIKSLIDYFYKPRSFAIKKIYAKSKGELTKKDKLILKYILSYKAKSEVVICADFDFFSDPLNKIIIEYTKNKNYHLVWMNLDIEDVFLKRRISKNDKEEEAKKFLLHSKTKIKNIEKDLRVLEPLNKNQSSNILIILDELLKEYKL